MTTLDIIILAGAVAFGAYGLYKGIISQIGSVVALIVGYLVARSFDAPLSNALGINQFIAAVILFILGYVAVIVIAKIIRFTAHLALLGPLDRFCGALFGLIKWFVLTSLLFNLFMFCKPDAEFFAGRLSQFSLHFLPKLLGVAQQYIS